MFLESSKTSRNLIWGATGEAKIGPGDAPAEVPKSRSQTRHAGSGKFQANGSRKESKNVKPLILLMIIFNVLSASLVGRMFNGFSNGFGIKISILFMIYLEMFEYRLKLADLCK